MKLLSSANNVNRGGRGSSGGRAWATTEAEAIVVATLVEGAATSHGLATTIISVRLQGTPLTAVLCVKYASNEDMLPQISGIVLMKIMFPKNDMLLLP